MRLGIIGVSGFIGRVLAQVAVKCGHTVVGFSRKPSSHPGDFEMRRFDPAAPLALENLDVIINLAGESIFGLWTPKNQKRIFDSRVDSTRHLVNSLKTNKHAVRVLVNISAIGFYGNRGEEVLHEDSTPGEGFLADLAQAWEAEALKATEIGVRVVTPRLGLVIGKDERAMQILLPVFRFCLGGKLGSGRQWMSCIHVEDVAGMILVALENDHIQGAVNAVMKEPVRNSEFTRILAKAVRRPAVFTTPGFILKTILGSMSHLLLDSYRVIPHQGTDYVYRFSTVEAALANIVR